MNGGDAALDDDGLGPTSGSKVLDRILSVRGLSKHFAGVTAVEDVTFDVERGAVVALIGPNGAGKTTLFNMVSGVTRPTEGSVVFDGRDVTRWRPHRIAELGLSRTFQNVRLFPQLNVIENVLSARYCRTSSTFAESLVGMGRARRERRENYAMAAGLLERVGLKSGWASLPNELNYGDQRRLEIARALATEPTMLILDEPCAGMIKPEVAALSDLITSLHTSGLSIMLIEHNVEFVMNIAERVIVLNFGRLIAQGSPAEVREHQEVVGAYLGGGTA